jgi:Spy/CpxP family protein refolding chaperone
MEVEMSRGYLMLLSGVLLMLFTGCSSPHHGSYNRASGDYWNKADQDVSGLVEKHVQDPEKVKQVNAVMGEIITEIKSAQEQHRQYHRALYELNANYSASPEEFTKILDELNNSRMRSAAKILGLRFKMKALLTAQEWAGLSEDLQNYGSRYYGKRTDSTAPAAPSH